MQRRWRWVHQASHILLARRARGAVATVLVSQALRKTMRSQFKTWVAVAWLAALLAGCSTPSPAPIAPKGKLTADPEAYIKEVKMELAARWSQRAKPVMDKIADGSVVVAFEITPDGWFKVLSVEPKDGANELAVQLAREAVDNAGLDPSAAVAAWLKTERRTVTITFRYFNQDRARESLGEEKAETLASDFLR